MRALVLIWFLGTLLARAGAAELQVFAAASLSDALSEIGRSFEQEGGERVRFNFAGSSTLARQIKEGAPTDLFISADQEKMDGLEKADLIRPETRRNLLGNSLVVVVSPESGLAIINPAALTRARRIALAEPSTVPAGIYARKYLEAQGLWETLRPKVVATENVRAALAAVEAGNAEAAIVYRTDAAISKRAKVAFEIPAAETPGIVYPVAVLRAAKNPAGAERFLGRLRAPEGRRAFENYGFVTLP